MEFGLEGDPFSISCKLPRSAASALKLPYAKPTGYGLGKSGWVSAEPSADQASIELFKAWIDESYRAQAPKKLIAMLDEHTTVHRRSPKSANATTRSQRSEAVTRKK